MHSRFTKFIDQCNLLTPCQFGFRKNKSTELALLHQKEYILSQFDNRALVIGIFVDFSKAFDLVNHELLLKKLWYYGIRGQAAMLIKSYLSQRKQAVSLHNVLSEVKPIFSGVPQGSVLGPLLFNIFLNDIVNINKNAKFIIYADDTSIFFAGKNIQDLIVSCNTTMVTLEKWSKSNDMRVNEKKTKAVIFRPKNKPVSIHSYILYNSRPIEIVNHFKCLGVIFSSTMSWEHHVTHVVKQLARVVGMIGCTRHILPTSLKLTLYNALFYSHVNYCHLVWGTATHSCLRKIHMLQKRVLRYAFNVSYGSPSKGLFLTAGVVQIYELYRYRLSISYKTEIKNGTNHIRRLANLQEKTTNYPFRQPEQWMVPTARLNSGQERLQFTLPSLLNAYTSAHFDLFTCTHKVLRRMYIEGSSEQFSSSVVPK